MRELVSQLFRMNANSTNHEDSSYWNGDCVHNEQLMSDCGRNGRIEDHIENSQMVTAQQTATSISCSHIRIDWYENESKSYSCVIR